MKEKYIKPTMEIITLPEEEFFTSSGPFGSRIFERDDQGRYIIFLSGEVPQFGGEWEEDFE